MRADAIARHTDDSSLVKAVLDGPHTRRAMAWKSHGRPFMGCEAEKDLTT